MALSVVLFALGIACLVKGGGWFVDGAVEMANRFNIPKIIVGATVVSIGTTLPEVMVSVQAAMQGNAGISYGNALGSIICNAGLIAAIALLTNVNRIKRKSILFPGCAFFIAAGFYASVAYISGSFTRLTGIILLVMCFTYITLLIKQPGDSPEELSAAEKAPLGKTILLVAVGAVFIAIGARLIVDNGTHIAKMLGVPDSVIGLTIVAIGTSLPEMTTTITSIIKKQHSLSLGNVIGANILNITLVSGAAITVSPFSLPSERTINGINSSLIIDIPVMLLVMLILCLPVIIKERTYKWQGISLVCIYILFCIYQILL